MEPRINETEYEAFERVSSVLIDNGRAAEGWRLRGYGDALMALPMFDEIDPQHMESYMMGHLDGQEDLAK